VQLSLLCHQLQLLLLQRCLPQLLLVLLLLPLVLQKAVLLLGWVRPP
jgi:hypothetical protein